MSAVRAENRPARTCVALTDEAIGAHRGSMSTLVTLPIDNRGSWSSTAASTPNQPPRIVTLACSRPGGFEQRLGEPHLARDLVLVERGAEIVLVMAR